LRSVHSPDEVATIAGRLLRRLREPITIDGRKLFVSGSIGVAISPQHGTTAEELIKNADAAMYRAKAAGAGAVMFYDSAIEADMRRRVSLESDVRDAIQRREFALLYQPIVDVASGRIVACEALARWQHPVRGLLLPDTFIGVAEETGLIHDLTAWVLAEACRFGASIRADRPDFRVTVNLSPSDLRENDIVAVIREQLRSSKLEPAGLEIEVTENVLLEDTALVAVKALRAMGVQIAVDDFGIAYNSLLHVKRLPLTTIKIDRLFVGDLAHDRFDQAIVKTIGTLGRSLGLRVVAEGVETETQWDFIREIGCDEVQGFRFSRPVEPHAFEEMLCRTY
jgi:predicted signal transduction protein with EAL and GGDEF domain